MGAHARPGGWNAPRWLRRALGIKSPSRISAFDAPVELRRAKPPTIVVHPGPVTSRHDGQVHRISFTQLCQLYGVDPRTALNAAHPAHAALARYRRDLDPTEVIDLFPREDCQYEAAALSLDLREIR